MTSDPKNMGLDTSTRLFGCLLLEILRKIIILIMATANLHINELNLNVITFLSGFIMTSDPKNMGVDTSTRLFGCLLLEILRKIVISKMATTNLHINGFLQKCSRVPEWHQSEYSFRWSGDHKNAEKHCVDPNARFSGQHSD